MNDKADTNQSSEEGNKEQETLEENDFFERLKSNEKKLGKDARGKGHGLTTFIEILMGDW